ncbi:YceI family protein [Patiriisocius marinus]|uniref:Lipid/polyisoprenoid-binding YceI-like domain-containing protein n=1 Tax=Patiriisocius marinus TaxID=1397112 RepID=A0A5J4J4Y1_9FLAO|nr:YceI family protein [Patiriisocius marinus]GER59557.1 hypothetical protein ULMA_16650 [Patiriisocius marinus]
MQKTISTLIITLSLSLLVNAQNNTKDDTKVIHSLVTNQSIINWTGSYLFKYYEHKGTVDFKKGNLITKNGNIIGGSFVIDMTTISNEEYRLDNGNGPIGHLKNSDFFDVAIYPEAKLELTKVTYYSNTNEHRLEGNLIIKEISKPIMIKAMVDDVAKTIKTKFKIDRRDWGINYESKFKDSAISDAIAFDILLQF